jgi:hypothetical protein
MGPRQFRYAKLQCYATDNFQESGVFGKNRSAPLSAWVLALARVLAATDADTRFGTLAEFLIRNRRLME